MPDDILESCKYVWEHMVLLIVGESGQLSGALWLEKTEHLGNWEHSLSCKGLKIVFPGPVTNKNEVL